jgi:hypothetical protein
MDGIIEILFRIMVFLFFIFTACLVCLIPYFIYREYKEEKFYLKKSEWICGKSHKETNIGGYFVGKVYIPTRNEREECDVYEKVK